MFRIASIEIGENKTFDININVNLLMIINVFIGLIIQFKNKEIFVCKARESMCVKHSVFAGRAVCE